MLLRNLKFTGYQRTLMGASIHRRPFSSMNYNSENIEVFQRLKNLANPIK